MESSSTSGIIIFSIIVLVVLIAAYFISSSGKNLNSIKSKPVGDGQFGDQHWATKQELILLLYHMNPKSGEMAKTGHSLRALYSVQ